LKIWTAAAKKKSASGGYPDALERRVGRPTKRAGRKRVRVNAAPSDAAKESPYGHEDAGHECKRSADGRNFSFQSGHRLVLCRSGSPFIGPWKSLVGREVPCRRERAKSCDLQPLEPASIICLYCSFCYKFEQFQISGNRLFLCAFTRRVRLKNGLRSSEKLLNSIWDIAARHEIVDSGLG
jgi:hypothetical protein